MSLEVGKEYYYPYYLNMNSKNDSIYLGRAHKIKILEIYNENINYGDALTILLFSVVGLYGIYYTFDRTSMYEIDSVSEKLFNRYELDNKESTRDEFMKNSKRVWV